MNIKTCTKCRKDFPATLEFFYKNAGGKYGVTPRCKSCVNEDNKTGHERRKAVDPEKIRLQGNARARKHYYADLEASRKQARINAENARNDPVRGAIIKARKRAGGAKLSPEEIQAIRDRQNNLCAICSNPNPTDLDHCHSTGNVRWLLCNHCNRGLGAFKDNPELLLKAAFLLQTIN